MLGRLHARTAARALDRGGKFREGFGERLGLGEILGGPFGIVGVGGDAGLNSRLLRVRERRNFAAGHNNLLSFRLARRIEMIESASARPLAFRDSRG